MWQGHEDHCHTEQEIFTINTTDNDFDNEILAPGQRSNNKRQVLPRHLSQVHTWARLLCSGDRVSHGEIVTNNPGSPCKTCWE